MRSLSSVRQAPAADSGVARQFPADTRAQFGFALLAAAVLAVAASWGWRFAIAGQAIPMPAGDATFFYPVALSHARGEGLVHPFTTPLPDATDFRFTWHGWAYPMVLSVLNWTRSYVGVIRADLLLALLNTVLGLALALRLSRSHVVPAVLLPVVYQFSLFFLGRPDMLAYTWLILLLGVNALVRAHWPRLALSGLLFGLLGATQPTVAVLAVLVWLAHLAATHDAVAWVRSSVTAGMVAVATLAAATFVLYPYPIGEWVRGLAEHAEFQAIRTDANSPVAYYIADVRAPLLGVWGIALLALAASHLRHGWKRPLFVFTSGSLLLGVWWYAVRLPQSSYNVAPLIAVGALAVASMLRDVRPPLYRRAPLLLLLGMSIVASAAIARAEVVNLYSVGAPSHRAAVAGVTRYGSLPGAVVGVPRSFLPLLSLAETRGTTVDDDCLDGSKQCTHLIVAQANSGYSEPPVRWAEEYHLVEHSFVPRQSGPGTFLFNTPKSFGFAVYQRRAD